MLSIEMRSAAHLGCPETRGQSCAQVATQILTAGRCWVTGPRLWNFANVVIWFVHPWVSLRVWWLDRPMRS